MVARSLTAAAVRLSNLPAPLETRLKAAEAQIIQAVEQGAQLVVLPEVFNTGYAYTRENYAHAEPLDGPTIGWMKRLAAQHRVHLAGSLLLLGPEHITNSLILVAPDGRLWRYDKNHPWVWERLYFREGREITVAQTEIGTFGLLICIDALSPAMFKRYASRVDALIISASPPRYHEVQVQFPDGKRVPLVSLISMTQRQRELSDHIFGEHVRSFGAWLGVPVIQATPCGLFSSPVPVPWLSFAVLLAGRPSLWHYLPQGRKATLTGAYFAETQVVKGNGEVAARYDDESDGFALAAVELKATPPVPSGKPPSWSRVAQGESLMFEVLSWPMIPFYRRGVQRAWGRSMAPIDHSTRIWRGLLWAAWVGGYLWGRLRGWRRRARRA